MINKIIILSLVSILAACQSNSSETKSQDVNRAPAVSATVSPAPAPAASISNASPADKNPKIKTFNGVGVVTKINAELVSVELDHEEIKGLMPAMRMEFYVKEKSELETLKVGDKVGFVLEDNAGAERIISIKKAQ